MLPKKLGLFSFNRNDDWWNSLWKILFLVMKLDWIERIFAEDSSLKILRHFVNWVNLWKLQVVRYILKHICESEPNWSKVTKTLYATKSILSQSPTPHIFNWKLLWQLAIFSFFNKVLPNIWETKITKVKTCFTVFTGIYGTLCLLFCMRILKLSAEIPQIKRRLEF